MKFALYVFWALCLSATPALAASVNYPIGYISATQNDVTLPYDYTTGYDYPVSYIDDSYTGTLAANTSITFDFSVTSGDLAQYSMTLTGNGDYNADFRNYTAHTGLYYNGGAQVTLTGSTFGTSPANAYGGTQDTNGIYTADPLVVAIAHIVDGQNVTVTITNNGPFVANFLARIQTSLGNLPDTFGYAVNYSSISTVPLPASLPLFGAALLALGFIAARRRSLR